MFYYTALADPEGRQALAELSWNYYHDRLLSIIY